MKQEVERKGALHARLNAIRIMGFGWMSGLLLGEGRVC